MYFLLYTAPVYLLTNAAVPMLTDGYGHSLHALPISPPHCSGIFNPTIQTIKTVLSYIYLMYSDMESTMIDNIYNISYTVFITSVRFKEEYTMKPLPQISEAEFEVMKIVWKHAPISTNEITDRLVKTTPWSPKTIQTLIKRLVTKGALSYEKQSRVFVYTPLVDETEYIGQESNTFLNRFYDGNITAMLSAYIDNDKLSEAEINELRSLLSKN